MREGDLKGRGRGLRRFVGLLLTAASVVLGMAVLASPASAAPHPLTCKSGYVWREAFPGDAVCVLWSSASRDIAREENRLGPSRTVPGSAFCKSGFVWREARPSDLVCVPPAARDRVRNENLAAIHNVANPVGVGRPFQAYAWGTKGGTSTNLYVYGDVSSATPNGRVSFYAIGRLSGGGHAWIGTATMNGSGSVSRALLKSGWCGTEWWKTYPVVALDERTGRLAYANDAWVYGC
jgi:hypothetical protein